MDEFVTKPIAPELLYDVVARWLRARPVRGGRRSAPPAPRVENPASAAAPVLAAPPPERLIDEEALALTFGGNPFKMRKYALLFLASAHAALLEIGEAIGREDWQRVSELGHRVKSSARAVGATGFAELCHELEALDAQQGALHAPALAQRMAAQLAELDDYIAHHVALAEP